MNTIMPQSELVKKALRFILEKKETHPCLSITDILDEAGMRFNLSPMEAMELERLLTANQLSK